MFLWIERCKVIEEEFMLHLQKKLAFSSFGLLTLLLLAFHFSLFSLPLASASNSVKNPGCEINTNNWGSWQGTLTRTTAVAHSGVASCEIAYKSGGSYTLDDNPTTITNPVVGRQYTASAWVRSSNAVNKSAQIVLRQSGGSAAQKSVAGPAVTLGTAWKEVTVTATMDAGRTGLEVYIIQNSATSGNKIQIDDIALDIVSVLTPTPSPIPTVIPTLAPSPSSGPIGTDCGTIPSANVMNANTYPCPLFGSSSPWNTPATGLVDPQSAIMISSNTVGSLKYSFTQRGSGFDIAGTTSYPDYGIPLYYADSLTPRINIGDNTGWWGGMTAVPMPSQAKPAVGTDHHLSIWDVSNHTIYEFWNMTKASNGTWSAGLGAKFDTNGVGYQNTVGAGSARAYGGSSTVGAIRYQEMKDGEIKHALAMAYPGSRGQAYAMGLGADGITRNIASHSDNSDSLDRNGSANIPEGARLRLKSTVDVNAKCGTNNACQTLGRAMQTYGLYVVDNSGAPAIAAEVLTGKSVSWTGVLSVTDARAFAADDFELLSLPTTLTQSP